jgi:dTDP-4-amino-4,6-dideoxygalactose transaminase
MALVHIPDLVPGVRAQQEQLPLQSRKTVFMLAAQLLAYELLVRPSVASTATRLFRWLTAKGMVVGSSSEQEYGAELPREYGYKASPVQCRIGRREVLRIEGNVRARTMATERYFAELPGLGFGVPRLPEGADAMLLRFPVRVANKQDALDQAGRYGAEIGSWFECPLHPKETELRAFGYREGDCPAAEKASLEVINLPTHRRVGERDFTRTLTFLRDVCRPAI